MSALYDVARANLLAIKRSEARRDLSPGLEADRVVHYLHALVRAWLLAPEDSDAKSRLDVLHVDHACWLGLDAVGLEAVIDRESARLRAEGLL